MMVDVLFAPPESAAALYFGDVMHARLKPVGHRFAYRVFCLLIDIDRLAEAAKSTRLFSLGRFNLLSFRAQDHGSGGALRPHIESLLESSGKCYDRIVLLCYPRVLGFVFNPISVYFCYCQGEISALVYEVRNTFGQIHSYVAPIAPGELNEAGLRQERAKLFYVSPFMDMNLTYKFRVRPPAETVAFRILETDREGPVLAATFIGKRADLNAANVLFATFFLPFMTFKVVFGIYWEALKLWVKGMRLRSRPNAPARSSLAGIMQTSAPKISNVKGQ